MRTDIIPWYLRRDITRMKPWYKDMPICTCYSSHVVRDEVARNLPRSDNQDSNDRFEDHELHCLLRALINGTIQPDLYNGRALPVDLINQLMAHVDNATNQFLQYAQLPAQTQRWTAAHPITMYIETLENDALYHLTTGAHDDNETWYRGFLAYVDDEDCPEPAVMLATILRETPGNEGVASNNIIRAIERAMITNRRQ